MLRLLVYVVPVALAIYALIDFSRSEPSERAGIRPLVWLAIIVLLPVLGPVVWIVISRTHGSPGGRAARTPRGPSPRTWSARRPGPRAPDDDPDFLWRLEQERRRRRAAGEPVDESGGDGTGGTPGPDGGTGPGGAGSDGDPRPDGPDER